jgi:trehalose 2-sulfotransferase
MLSWSIAWQARPPGVARGVEWHPHFGNIAGTDLATWLAGYPDQGAPERSIVLATDERTGSEWLCQLLGASGRLGRPSEYLNTSWMRRYIRDYPDDVPAQVAIAHRVGTTANRCFAMKIHPWHLDRLLERSTVSGTFPSAHFVRLTRRDLLGQAISLYRAQQTGRYHAHIPPERAVDFDADAIERMVQVLALNRARWEMYFARTGIRPLMLSYEDLRADPHCVVRQIAEYVGERVKRRDVTAAQPIGQQADSISAEWRERFVRARGSVDTFASL